MNIDRNIDLIKQRKSSKRSKGEQSVICYLRKARIKFITEHYFADLLNDKTGSLLFFDFFLPKLGAVVEVDGSQRTGLCAVLFKS